MTRRLLRLFDGITLLALAALGALGHLGFQIWAGRVLQSPTFGPMRFLGEPVELVGIAGLIGLLYVHRLRISMPGEQRNRYSVYVLALSSLGLGLVMWGFAAREGKSVPVQYLVAAICAVSIFGVTVVQGTAGVTSVIRHAWQDFCTFSRRPAAWAILVVGIGVVTFGPKRALSETVQTGPEFERWFAKQERVALPASVKPAIVTIAEFIDYQCPYSKQAEVRYKPLFDELRKSFADRVQVLRYDYPLDGECNDTKGLRSVHPAACEAAAGVRFLRGTGQEPVFENWLWSHQNLLSHDSVFTELETRFGITDLDRRYQAELPLILNDVVVGKKLGLRQTPTFWVNGVVMSGMSLESFRWAVMHELGRAGQPPSRVPSLPTGKGS